LNRTQRWVALIVLGLAAATPASLHARSSKHPEANQDVQKSAKQYNKQLRKDQKRQAKVAKKQTRQNKKRVQTLHSVT
jgi:hypothetical protein